MMFTALRAQTYARANTALILAAKQGKSEVCRMLMASDQGKKQREPEQVQRAAG